MHVSSRHLLVLVLATSAVTSAACSKKKGPGDPPAPSASAVATIVAAGATATDPHPAYPMVAATQVATIVYESPNVDGARLGYLRLGSKVRRDADPVHGRGCKGEFYRVYPAGFVCTEQATIDLEDPVVRAAAVGPDLSQPLPYHYGFVRATAPQYLRIPTKAQQLQSEMGLLEHLQWFADNAADVQKVIPGANDVALDDRGVAVPGLRKPAGFRPSTELSRLELFGGKGEGAPPFWLAGGDRQIPNVSDYKVPPYALFTNRVNRKTGLSFIGAFNTKDDDLERLFAVTPDLRLIPTTKVKPDTASAFHGVEVSEKLQLPFAFVVSEDSTAYQLVRGRDETRTVGEKLPRRVVIPLSGVARIKAGERHYQSARDATVWLRGKDIAVVAEPSAWPEAAEKGEKWIHISLRQQTLVLYQGKKPWYATLVSTGRDGAQDPKTTLSTPQGTFHLRSKHIAATMDSEEQSAVGGGGARANGGSTEPSWDAEAKATVDRLKKAKAAGKKLSVDDERRWKNVEKGRHPEHGVTRRRGSGGFELRDVPWIQYFAAGYALHGAYWHDVFGRPRSHGCVNLAPIDARLVFLWTEPAVPEGWHGINTSAATVPGTTIFIEE